MSLHGETLHVRRCFRRDAAHLPYAGSVPMLVFGVLTVHVDRLVRFAPAPWTACDSAGKPRRRVWQRAGREEDQKGESSPRNASTVAALSAVIARNVSRPLAMVAANAVTCSAMAAMTFGSRSTRFKTEGIDGW